MPPVAVLAPEGEGTGEAGATTGPVVVPVAALADEELPDVPGAAMGVMVTPVTFPVTVAFCFLLVVPRAFRVASALADAAARAAVERGARGFFGAMSKAARIAASPENIPAIVDLSVLTAAPLVAMAAARAVRAFFSDASAVCTAVKGSMKDCTNAAASGAVYCFPASIRTTFGQYFGMPEASA